MKTGAAVPSPTDGLLPIFASARARALLVALVCLVAFLPGFAVLPVTDRDEGRFAQASKQMLETGDLVDIRFQDEARHKKPIGIYWLQSAAVTAVSAATGDATPDIWAYRIPSFLGATVAAVATAWIGAMLFGPAVGLAAGLMIAGALVVGVEARLAKTDAALFATIVIAQGVLATAYMRHGPAAAPGGPRLGRPAALAFWAAVGVGILIKGPVLPLVVGATIIGLIAADRRAGWLRALRPLVGLPLAVLIVLPWLVAITVVSQGAFFEASVGGDFLGKLFGEQVAHVFWPGYYALTHMLTFWPFAALTVLALPWVWRRRRDPAVRFCLAWIVPTWIVFEATPVKLLHYVMPVFPAVAMLAAAALFAGYDTLDRRPGRRAFLIAAVVAAVPTLVLGAAFAAAPLWEAAGLVLLAFDPAGFDPIAALGVAVAGAAVTAGLVLVRRARPWPAIVSLVVAALVLYPVAYGRVLPALDTLWISRGLAEAVTAIDRADGCAGHSVATAGFSEPSLVFQLGTGTRLVRSGTLAADHLLSGDPCALALVEERQLGPFLQRLEDAGRAGFGQAIVGGLNYAAGREAYVHVFSLDAE
jgi:4-amino-4-deoxy-L-arabinose transferase-like glycosyltransferase